MHTLLLVLVVVAGLFWGKFENANGSTIHNLINLGQVDGKNYFYERGTGSGRNWTTAGNYCIESGMQLATIETSSQAEFLKLKANSTAFGGTGYWVGARDAQLPRQFTWNATGTAPIDSIGVPWTTFDAKFDYQTCVYYVVNPLPTFAMMGCARLSYNVLCQT